MSTPFRLVVPKSLVREMVEHARAEAPFECCGLLAGRILAGERTEETNAHPVGNVVRRYPLTNILKSPTRFLSDDHSMFAAVRDMQGRQIDILAVYHSHPTSDPIPSRTDLDLNYSPEVVNLIVSLKEEYPTIRAWWLREQDFREADWEALEAEGQGGAAEENRSATN